MLSPVVVGVSKPAARRLQIAQRSVSWADLAQLASAGELRFAMGDPRHTGDGLAALIGVASATAATGAALRPENVTCEHLHGFLTGDKLSADTSAGLIDEFISHQHELDALVGYESVLLSLNDSGRLPEPLEIIYPADGIVWSNYPMLLLDPAKRAAYDRAVTWLRSAPVQRQIMELTARRPIDPAIVRNTRLLATTGNALYFPDESEVTDRLLATYDSLLATKEFHGCP
jgi:Ca-activated chloride channel family protein